MNIHIIRTDGREEDHTSSESEYRDAVEKLISASCLDHVNIFKNPANRGAFGMRMPVMLLDDHGYDVEEVEHGPGQVFGLDVATHIERKPIRARKPVNAKATALYHSVCVPGTTHEIVGDVAIIDDESLA